MKIWCIFKGDTAIKWRELLVVEQPSPLACVAYNISGETPAGVTLDKTLGRNNIWAVDFIGVSVRATLGQGTANGK